MPKVAVWAESEDRSGTATELTAVPDLSQGIQTNGDNLRLPAGFNYPYCMYAWTEKSSYIMEKWTLNQSTIANVPWTFRQGFNASFKNGSPVNFSGNSPYLADGEDTTVTALEADEAGVSHVIACVVMLGRTPSARPLYPAAQAITHISSGSGSQLAGADDDAWQSSTLTQNNELPSGEYAIIGGKVISNTAYISRLVLGDYEERIPLIPNNDEDGPLSVFNMNWSGRFTFKIPDLYPSLEIVAKSQDTPNYELYLRKIA